MRWSEGTETMSRTLLLLFAPIISIPLVASVAVGQDTGRGLAKWDQQRVTKLAEGLSKAVDELNDEFYNQPPSTIGSGQSHSFLRLKQDIRRVRSEARHLKSALADGKGHDETLPIFEHLMVIVRDAREEVQKQFTSSQLLGKATAAGDALRQVEPYYDAKALSGPGS